MSYIYIINYKPCISIECTNLCELYSTLCLLYPIYSIKYSQLKRSIDLPEHFEHFTRVSDSSSEISHLKMPPITCIPHEHFENL